MAKTSLERSHSKSSNFKLTLMCFLATISLNGLFITYGLSEKLGSLATILYIVFGALTVLSLFLFSIFKR